MVEHDRDLDAVLAGLHRRVLAAGDYYWGGEDSERPRTVEQLMEMLTDEDFEDLADVGTHSILDIHQMKLAGSPDEFGTVVALSDEEIIAAFGTGTPSRAEFEAAY